MDEPARHGAARHDHQDFLSDWLQLVCRNVPALAAVVVIRDDESGQFKPAAALPAGQKPSNSVTRAVEVVAASHAPRTVTYQRVGLNDAGKVFGYPIAIDSVTRAIITCDLGAASSAVLEERMQRVRWAATWLEAWLVDRHVRRTTSSIPDAVLHMLATAQAADGALTAAHLVASGLADVYGCHRVAVGLWNGQRNRLAGMSHAATVHSGTELADAYLRTLDEACLERTVVVAGLSDGSETSEPGDGSAVRLAHRDLLSLQPGRTSVVVSCPFFRGDTLLGAITFLYHDTPPSGRATAARLDSVSELVGPLVARQFEAEVSLGRLAVTRLHAHAADLIGPDHFGRKLLAGAVVLALMFFALFRTPFHVTSEAKLEGATQRVAAVPYNSFLTRVHAKPGDRVKANDELATLDDQDLRLDLDGWISRREQYKIERQRFMSEQKFANAAVLAAQIDEANAQVTLLKAKIERASIRAPFDALIVDGDLTQAIGRPLTQGEVLFTLTPLDAFRITIDVDERDVLYTAVGQRGTILLTAAPRAALPFSVTRVTAVNVSVKGRNAFKVEGRLDGPGAWLRPGMEGVARIETPPQLLAWIWTRRFLDWLRLQLWTWRP